MTGSFCWLELATVDLEQAIAFYGRLFPWERLLPTPDHLVGPYFEYCLLRTPEGEVGGAYELLNEQRTAGVLPHWLPYVSVESADRLAERTPGLGGSVVVPPMDVLEMGRMVVLRDPTGATIAAWEPRSHTGFQTSPRPGHPFWLELVSSEPERAGAFFTELFGWTQHTLNLEAGPYTILFNDGARVAGIADSSASDDERRPGWQVYFGVSDIEAACKTIAARGGALTSPLQVIPEIGRSASAVDPEGARFALIEPA